MMVCNSLTQSPLFCFLSSLHHGSFLKKHNVSETGAGSLSSREVHNLVDPFDLAILSHWAP